MATENAITRDTGINYNFVCACYGSASLLCIALYILDYFFDYGEGYWVIFAPFLPCFLWSFYMRRCSQNLFNAGTEEDSTKINKEDLKKKD